ncbi:tol-pal system-associated acyl-CoA thioesterase [Aquibaculum sediminis]|uniref:tol-pal system-associated acyl-CoA thioesterase n=1 Tax=Aquibaculum sediminis TaxID=3231907 RepID=UPI003F5DBD56
MTARGPATGSVGYLRGCVHVMPLRVYYEDTDAQGIVYHANYLRFAERARSELVRLLSIDQRRLKDEEGLGFAVRRVNLDYRSPARFDDLLEVHTCVTGARPASIDVHQRVLRDGHLLVDIGLQLAMIRLATRRPVRMPAEVRRHLQEFCQPERGSEQENGNGCG